MKRNQSGFTLIEIAIVLVIIGLLLGGVLKGQELINSAKVKNLATDFKNIPIFIYGYQDKFKALPGDDGCAYTSATCTNPHLTAPAIVLANSGGSGNGNGNGVIDGKWIDTAATPNSEAYNFWQHIRVAGLAPGSIDPTGDFRPTNSAGGSIGIQSGSVVAANVPMYADAAKTLPIRGSYVICSSGILGKFVKQLDTTLDDGNTATGSMMATDTTLTPYAMGAVATAAGNIVDSNSYVVCYGV